MEILIIIGYFFFTTFAIFGLINFLRNRKIDMNLTDEFQPIRNWAQDKGIYDKGDAKTQYIKLLEEAGELAKAILKEEEEEFVDAIGDCVVVLTNLAKLKGYNIEDCINSAYEVIAKRKGIMQNGTFVKES